MENKENKPDEFKGKTNKLLPVVIICAIILIVLFVIFQMLFNTKRDNVSLTSEQAELILKEKTEIYKKIIDSQPYCGDNANQTTDEINEYKNVVLYWNVSTQFKSYEQLLNFISENVTENQIQKLKTNNSYPTFKENLYLEKDNKLYCGVTGTGSINPDDTTYEIIEYNDDKITGIATDTYGTDTINLGLVSQDKYKYNITLVKENELWKIDKYELDNN